MSTAIPVGIYFQVYYSMSGMGGNIAAMCLEAIPAGLILTIPFCVCLVLPMVFLGWLPCKTSSQTLLVPGDSLESQPVITTRTYLSAFVLVALVMAVIANTMQARGVTASTLVKNTENNLLFVRNTLVLAVTFYLTWAYAYLQWALGRSRKYSNLMRALSSIGLVLAHSGFWSMIAYAVPFTDPIFGCNSAELTLDEVLLSSMHFGFVLSLSPVGVFWVLRKAGFRLCYRGKPIGAP